MSPLADFLLNHVPFPSIPHYLTTYVPGETPLSTTNSVLTALALYLAGIFGVQALMKNQDPHKLSPLFRAHNMFLSVGSLVLFILMLEEILPIMWSKGVFVAMCADEAWTPVNLLPHSTNKIMRLKELQRMEFYYLINYSFKYLELFDTIFLAFKKKPLRK